MACGKCDNGYITNVLGIKIKCNCNIEGNIEEGTQGAIKPVYHVTGAQREMAVARKLIPDARQHDEFDEQLVKTNIMKMCSVQNTKVVGFDKYMETLSEIMLKISTNVLDRSYIIGAPNGFGKTTFANTAIKRLDAMGKKAVPYISLFEIGDLRVEHEKFILGYLDKRDMRGGGNYEDTVKDEYSWVDYTRSDLLFTYLTTLENKKVEVRILRALMDIRGPKGLPTVVFTESSLKPYMSDNTFNRVFWDDMLAYDDTPNCDRLIHRSCYKIYNSGVQVRRGRDY